MSVKSMVSMARPGSTRSTSGRTRRRRGLKVTAAPAPSAAATRSECCPVTDSAIRWRRMLAPPTATRSSAVTDPYTAVRLRSRSIS